MSDDELWFVVSRGTNERTGYGRVAVIGVSRQRAVDLSDGYEPIAFVYPMWTWNSATPLQEGLRVRYEYGSCWALPASEIEALGRALDQILDAILEDS